MCWDRQVNQLATWWRTARAQPRRADAIDMLGLLVVGTMLIALELVGLWPVGAPDPAGPSRWWHLVPLVAVIALLPWRRTRPMFALGVGLIAFAGDLALGGSLGVAIVLFDFIFSVARYGSARTVRWLVRVVALVVVAVAVIAAVRAGDVRTGVFNGLQAFAFAGAPVWWGMNVRQEAELAQAAEEVATLERQRAADLTRLAELRETEAVRSERERTARDLHDVIASHVSAVAIHAEAALVREPDADADRVALTAMRQSSVTALAEMRAMIAVLRSTAPDTDAAAAPPRLDQIDDLLAATRAGGLSVSAVIDVDDGAGALPAAMEQAAYRIVQEALTNAGKYASGSVEVSLRRENHELVTEVRSRGDRPSIQPSGGVGLVSMRERAEALNGTFVAGWDDGHWTVCARLPLVGAAV